MRATKKQKILQMYTDRGMLQGHISVFLNYS